MAFQLSDTVSKDKMFLVKRSELEGRLDTVFYKPEYRENELHIRNSVWGFDTVGHIAGRIADGPFGSDLKAEEYTPVGVPLLRVSNLKTGSIEGDIVFISDEKHKQLKRSAVFPNDVVLTKAGAILGYSAVFPENLEEGNITSHLVTITCRENVDPHYLSWFFRSDVGQLQIYRWGNKSTRPELNTGEVEKILVPLPPAEIQTQIVAKMNAAYSAKKQKEAQAQQLLDSIDSYLLHELGIDLPAEEENNISQRMFVRKFSEVSGGRFDAYFYLPKFKVLANAIRKLPFLCFSDLVELSNEQWDQASLFQDTFPYIEIGEIDTTIGEIKAIIDVDINDAPSRAKMVVRAGDLLISTTRPTRGAITFFDGALAIASTGFCVIRGINSERANKMFLFHVLRSHLCLNQMEQRSSGGNYPAITTEELRKVLIPLPPLEKQNEIAIHIQAIRDQAKQLRAEAAAGLEKARQEVEAMILGRDSNQCVKN